MDALLNTSEKPRHVRILTYNLFMRPPPVGTRDYKDKRLDLFIENVLPEFDIICLQEIFGTLNSRKRKLKYHAEMLGFQWVESPSPSFWSRSLMDGGLLILSRFPIISSDFAPFKTGILPDLLVQKGVLHAKINVNGAILNLFTAHTQASYDYEFTPKGKLYRQVRTQQLQIVKEFVQEKIKNSETLALLCGDLNVNGRYCGSEYCEMIETFESVNHEGVRNIVKEKFLENPATFGVLDEHGNPTDFVLTPLCDNCLDECLDYVLAWNSYDPNFNINWEDVQVESFSVKDQKFTQLSDHAGIWFSLTLNKFNLK